MPFVTEPFDLSGRPILDVYLSVSSIDREAMLEAGDTAPPAVPIKAMIDTGASWSVVDFRWVQSLEIAPVGDGLVCTASGDEPKLKPKYSVDLSLAGDTPGPIAIDHPVYESNLAYLRIDMLLGRDILERCVLTHDGVNRRFTLTFDLPPESPS